MQLLDSIEGVIDRRVLVNFRIDPDRVQGLLPAPFRPQLVDDHAIGGICLIRLTGIRPLGWPGVLGRRSENAAHRIAVEWDADGERRSGVYIPRRDTASRLNAVLGGRLFPGAHERADIETDEHDHAIDIRVRSRDGQVQVTVRGRVASSLPDGSVFEDVAAVSRFFEQDTVGYSPARSGELDALELETVDWEVEPLAVDHVTSSFFEDATRFPPGTVAFDDALLMRGIRHRWHRQPRRQRSTVPA